MDEKNKRKKHVSTVKKGFLCGPVILSHTKILSVKNISVKYKIYPF